MPVYDIELAADYEGKELRFRYVTATNSIMDTIDAMKLNARLRYPFLQYSRFRIVNIL